MDLTTNNDAFKCILSVIEDESSTENEVSLVEVNKIYVTIWLEDNKETGILVIAPLAILIK